MLVNNAGITRDTLVLRMKLDDWKVSMCNELRVARLLCRASRMAFGWMCLTLVLSAVVRVRDEVRGAHSLTSHKVTGRGVGVGGGVYAGGDRCQPLRCLPLLPGRCQGMFGWVGGGAQVANVALM